MSKKFFSTFSKTILRAKVQDESAIPEFIYAGKNIKPHTRVYVMGVSVHGALGERSFLRPTKGKKVYAYVHHPFRLSFADHHKVDDVACGYGFTVLGTSQRSDSQPFFGMGIANSCQIGYHCQRNGHPLEIVLEPLPIEIPLQKKFLKKSFVLCNGKLYSCGWSADGQTGRETYKNVENFGEVEGDLKGENVVKVSCKADCVLALTEKGEVFGWGNNEYRQLKGATDSQQLNVPRKLNLKNIDDKIIDIAASGSSCFALTELGEVWSWGYGALGTGPNNECTQEPVLIPKTLLGKTVLNPESKVTKIFAGVFSAGAVTSDGSLYVWGKNTGGCLGLGHTNFQYFPMRVCVASFVQKVSFGIDHMAVLAKSLV